MGNKNVSYSLKRSDLIRIVMQVLLLCCVALFHSGYNADLCSANVKAGMAMSSHWALLPDHLAEAVLTATAMKRTESFMELNCPTAQQIGRRPPAHTPERMGTKCEPWQNRKMIEVLWRFLDSSMTGLEWSTGSGTSWILRTGVTMHLVEHCEPWLNDISSKMTFYQVDPAVKQWYPHHVARMDGNGCDQDEPKEYADANAIFGNYARYPRKYLMDKYAPKGFDMVQVDGRHRNGCIIEAASLHDSTQQMLVNPHYGILLLDNAERPRLTKTINELPSYWLVVSFTNAVDETTVWMACPSVNDEACNRARQRISTYMDRLPANVIGNRYKAHMARARANGVPGA